MTQVKAEQEQQQRDVLEVLRDSASNRWVVLLHWFGDKTWAQVPQESATEFYTRIHMVLRTNKFPVSLTSSWEQYREKILADDYVDPILYESGFFRDRAHHDEVMNRVLANFEKKQQEQNM